MRRRESPPKSPDAPVRSRGAGSASGFDHAPARPGTYRLLTRRRVLAAISGAMLVVGGGAVLAVRTRGYDAAAAHGRLALTAWQWAVVRDAARRIAAPDEPSGSGIPTADDVDVAGFADVWVSRMDSHVARDFRRFLAYLEHVAPLRCGLLPRFTRLAPAEQDQVLTAVQESGSDLLRAGFEGLKSLVFLGYYRDPRTWTILGYDGPLVGRPAGGWK